MLRASQDDTPQLSTVRQSDCTTISTYSPDVVCNIHLVDYTPVNFSCDNLGPNLVTLKVTDVGGNVSYCTSTITVLDTTAPVITCPAAATLFCGPDYTGPAATATDNCGIDTIVSNFSLLSRLPSEIFTVTWTAYDISGNSSSCTQQITLLSELNVDTGSDQNVVIDSGPGPDPLPCTTLSALVSGGTPPYSYTWIPATGLSDPDSSSTSACPTTSTTYTLVVTDSNGCVSTDNVDVLVVDIDNPDLLPTVGNNDNKIYVCHLATCTTEEVNAQANCNSPNSLCAHLSHGDVLGECACKKGDNEDNMLQGESASVSDLQVYPNPFSNTTTIRFALNYDSRVSLSIYDVTGKEITMLFNGEVSKDTPYKINFDGSNHAEGMYFYSLMTDKGETHTGKLILNR